MKTARIGASIHPGLGGVNDVFGFPQTGKGIRREPAAIRRTRTMQMPQASYFCISCL
jgi:hypothetical protein